MRVWVAVQRCDKWPRIAISLDLRYLPGAATQVEICWDWSSESVVEVLNNDFADTNLPRVGHPWTELGYAREEAWLAGEAAAYGTDGGGVAARDVLDGQVAADHTVVATDASAPRP